MSTTDTPEKTDREILLSMETSINDLRSITGILFDLTKERLTVDRDTVTLTEAEAERIYYMVAMARREAENLKRLYYVEEVA